MPKKTKKNKILAEARSKEQALNLVSYNFVKPQSKPSDNFSKTETGVDVINSVHTANTRQTNVSILDHHHLRRDLIKILIFTFFALILQSMLYYFLRG